MAGIYTNNTRWLELVKDCGVRHEHFVRPTAALVIRAPAFRKSTQFSLSNRSLNHMNSKRRGPPGLLPCACSKSRRAVRKSSPRTSILGYRNGFEVRTLKSTIG